MRQSPAKTSRHLRGPTPRQPSDQNGKADSPFTTHPRERQHQQNVDRIKQKIRDHLDLQEDAAPAIPVANEGDQDA